jgi:hypothetical protein
MVVEGGRANAKNGKATPPTISALSRARRAATWGVCALTFPHGPQASRPLPLSELGGDGADERDRMRARVPGSVDQQIDHAGDRHGHKRDQGTERDLRPVTRLVVIRRLRTKPPVLDPQQHDARGRQHDPDDQSDGTERPVKKPPDNQDQQSHRRDDAARTRSSHVGLIPAVPQRKSAMHSHARAAAEAPLRRRASPQRRALRGVRHKRVLSGPDRSSPPQQSRRWRLAQRTGERVMHKRHLGGDVCTSPLPSVGFKRADSTRLEVAEFVDKRHFRRSSSRGLRSRRVWLRRPWRGPRSQSPTARPRSRHRPFRSSSFASNFALFVAVSARCRGLRRAAGERWDRRERKPPWSACGSPTPGPSKQPSGESRNEADRGSPGFCATNFACAFVHPIRNMRTHGNSHAGPLKCATEASTV